MSSLDRRLTSLALSLFNALEENTQVKKRVLTAACGMLATLAMWVAHLSFPYLFYYLLETESRLLFWAAFALAGAPPFAAVFSIGTLIYSQVNEPVEKESGPMAGYFYQERAGTKWKISIGAGIIAAVNFILMLVTSHSP